MPIRLSSLKPSVASIEEVESGSGPPDREGRCHVGLAQSVLVTPRKLAIENAACHRRRGT